MCTSTERPSFSKTPLQVYPGARIPADGEVLDGVAHVDESMITGESETVTKLAGSTVIGGTLNRVSHGVVASI